MHLMRHLPEAMAAVVRAVLTNGNTGASFLLGEQASFVSADTILPLACYPNARRIALIRSSLSAQSKGLAETPLNQYATTPEPAGDESRFTGKGLLYMSRQVAPAEGAIACLATTLS